MTDDTQDRWEGIYGSFPIPDQFRSLVRNRMPSVTRAGRAAALKELGDFYSWLYKQEAREAAKRVGIQRRAIERKETANRHQRKTAEGYPA